ncbi:MAG TPA: 50S ribosomal protein L4 [Gemmatimonadales bacterium]|jgi:large subunit ribosomal protein L4
MINAPHYSATGAKHGHAFALPDDTFDGVVNDAVLHQVVKAHLANQRQGTAKTKTRSFVSGGNQKPWKQKGTGRARQGSTRAPHWRGGGTVFGPIPRDYRADTNRKVRQLARRSALNARAREGMLHVIDAITMDAPKTSALLGILGKLTLADTKTLILTDGSKPPVYLSCRNVPHLEVLPFSDATAYDILRADALVIESGAFGAGGSDADGDEGEAETGAPRKRTAKVAKKASPRAVKSAAKSAARSSAKAAKRAQSKSEGKSAKHAASKKAAPKHAAAKGAKKSAHKKASE